MSSSRPTISAELVAALIETTPDRVRRRFDRTPEAASEWEWELQIDAWRIQAGEETVAFPLEHIASLEQVSCTCLLSPQCFHLLACVTSLSIATESNASNEDRLTNDSDDGSKENLTSDEATDSTAPSESQRRATKEMADNMGQLLRVGVANAGVVLQSGLLRSVHQCRAEGLHRVASLGIRTLAGINEYRTGANTSDPAQLTEDIASLLETTRYIVSRELVHDCWIGTARRKQHAVKPRRLHGLFAEPILTRSGYAGAAVYLLGEDDRIYSLAEAKPGDAQMARDAYRGGIQIGSLIQPAKELARGLYLGTDLTASTDGRLGRGKEIKIVAKGNSSWQDEAIRRRFERPIVEQWNDVYKRAELPLDARNAGWDLVFLSLEVQGAMGPNLLCRLTDNGQPLRLSIENQHADLFFRENLRMLSFAPGLGLLVIARVDLKSPATVAPLAIAELASAESSVVEPRLELPDNLGGRNCLGFDEIHREYLHGAQTAPVLWHEEKVPSVDDPLDALHRRWLGTMLSGTSSQRISRQNSLASEIARLHRAGFTTGAALLDALTTTDSFATHKSYDTFLAISLYLRQASQEFARSRSLELLAGPV